MKTNFYKELGNIFTEIEAGLIEKEATNPEHPAYTDEQFRAMTRIFMSGMVSKMYDLCSAENMQMNDMENMAVKMGEEIRRLIKTYTGIETHNLYKV